MSASDPLPYGVPARALAAAMPRYLLDYSETRLAVSLLCQLADETDALRARIATLEAALRSLVAAISETNTCIVCSCSLEDGLDSSPPHCLDCHPDEDKQIDWEERVPILRATIAAAQAPTLGDCRMLATATSAVWRALPDVRVEPSAGGGIASTVPTHSAKGADRDDS